MISSNCVPFVTKVLWGRKVDDFPAQLRLVLVLLSVATSLSRSWTQLYISPPMFRINCCLLLLPQVVVVGLEQVAFLEGLGNNASLCWASTPTGEESCGTLRTRTV